jgi:hypothetical protein
MAVATTGKYWFPAKRRGWGWGFPSAWQGWVVLVAYLTLVFGGVPFVHRANGSSLSLSLSVYLGYVAVLTVALVATCWLAGERPRWSGGNR